MEYFKGYFGLKLQINVLQYFEAQRYLLISESPVYSRCLSNISYKDNSINDFVMFVSTGEKNVRIGLFTAGPAEGSLTAEVGNI